ncbi:type IV toxin-antitoxin system AbiEi family antitoxin [Pseudoduganella albidiflava]|nr:type IV toxin-antitoxin system AbiEi family antitoxin [Pseudoduganella albidiflava]
MNEPRYRDGAGQAEEELVMAALAALQEKTAIKGHLVELEPVKPGSYVPDACIDLAHENGTSRYLVECKSLVDRRGQLDLVRRQLESVGAQGLLVAPHVSRTLAEHCKAIGLQFIDTCGNAYLRAPGLFILISGEKDDNRRPAFDAPRGLTNPAGLRVVFALLSRPELVNAPFKDIAVHAGVSLGTAYNALEDLERRGYLINKGKAGRRKLLERRRLVDEWMINFPTTLRTKLNGRRFSAPDPNWWQSFHSDAGFAWGAEVAAAKMTGYLKPVTQTLYVEATDRELLIKTLAKQYRIKPDLNGEIEVLEKFWHWQPESADNVAPPLLVYSELLAMLDPRTQETAEIIKERFIETTFDKT